MSSFKRWYMNTILTKIDEIAAVSSKNAKVELLKKYLQEDEFRAIVKYMLDPYITFGVLDFFPNENWDDYRDATFWELSNLLDHLAARRITGFEAQRELSEMSSRGVSRDLLLRILNKDPKAGFGASSVNKAWPGLIPEFPYMRCSLPKDSKIENFPWESGVYSQIKADGMFVNINNSLAGEVELMSRQGTIY